MAKCTHCDNTGSLSKDIFRELDCVHCDIALERVQLEGWLDHQGIQISAPEAWMIFSAGKAAAFKESAAVCQKASEKFGAISMSSASSAAQSLAEIIGGL